MPVVDLARLADVVALCRRVIVIHHGRILFDGDLARLGERFAAYKATAVDLADGAVDLAAYGDVIHGDGERDGMLSGQLRPRHPLH